MGPKDLQREREMEERIALIASESKVHEGVSLTHYRDPGSVQANVSPAEFIEILTPEEKARREAEARAQTTELILAEMQHAPNERLKLEERLRAETVEFIASEMNAGRKSVVYGG